MNADRPGAPTQSAPRPTPAAAGTQPIARVVPAGVVAALLVGLAFASPPRLALAQEEGQGGQGGQGDAREMTVEQLERFIEEQRAALEQVRENRDITTEKARRVRDALAEKEAERRATEAEVEALCRERDALDPGSYDDCLAQLDG